jgi:hypothetical protein
LYPIGSSSSESSLPADPNKQHCKSGIKSDNYRTQPSTHLREL